MLITLITFHSFLWTKHCRKFCVVLHGLSICWSIRNIKMHSYWYKVMIKKKKKYCYLMRMCNEKARYQVLKLSPNVVTALWTNRDKHENVQFLASKEHHSNVTSTVFCVSNNSFNICILEITKISENGASFTCPSLKQFK